MAPQISMTKRTRVDKNALEEVRRRMPNDNMTPKLKMQVGGAAPNFS